MMLNYAVSWLLGALLSWEVFLFFPLFFRREAFEDDDDDDTHWLLLS